MKKYLIASGCSWGDPNFISLEHPDMDCDWSKWPELLADKLDMQVINLCKSGQGQEYIYSSLIEKVLEIPKEEIGLVVAAWSTAPRRDYQLPIINSKNKIKWTSDHTDLRGSVEYWISRSMRYYYSFQSVLENLKIPYKQIQLVHLYTGYLWEELRKKGALYTKQDAPELDGELYKYKKEYQKRCSETIVNSPFYNKINKHFLNFNKSEITIDRISELDKHPSAKGQEQIKEFIYDRLG
tara:strand:- start:232 stop:948 length:717 start_codon:yes stop_codon:yes gene_type:complete